MAQAYRDPIENAQSRERDGIIKDEEKVMLRILATNMRTPLETRSLQKSNIGRCTGGMRASTHCDRRNTDDMGYK
jgi:hypothetical protein